MAVTIKEKSVKIGDRFIGSIAICYLPLFDGKLEPYTKSDNFEVTESEPGEIQKIIEEQKSITCQQLSQTH